VALSGSDREDAIIVRGIIIAVDWDDDGSVTSIAVSAHDEEEYVIEQGEDLLEFIREEVEITGVPKKKRKGKAISVKKLKLLGSSGQVDSLHVMNWPSRK
jgi:hypothetical protein